MSETSREEIKREPPYFEYDSKGVEIVPFNESYKTPYDNNSPKKVFLDGRSWRVHKLPPNFRANMNLYFKFRDGLPAENTFEQVTLQLYAANRLDYSLDAMQAELPALHEGFRTEYLIWRRLKEISNGGMPSRDDIEFKRIADALDADEDRQARRILYESSAYAYLAPKMVTASHRLLTT